MDENQEQQVQSAGEPTLDGLVWSTLPGFTPEQKTAYIQSLYAIASIDGEIAREERELLAAIGKRLGMSGAEFEAALPGEDFKISDVHIEPPANLDDRVQWMRNLVRMVVVDGKLKSSEHQVCVHFSAKLGFPPSIVSDVLSKLA